MKFGKTAEKPNIFGRLLRKPKTVAKNGWAESSKTQRGKMPSILLFTSQAVVQTQRLRTWSSNSLWATDFETSSKSEKLMYDDRKLTVEREDGKGLERRPN